MIGSGWVGSAAPHVYLAAPRERRFCLPNTRFLIHRPSGGIGGKASDIAIPAQEIVRAQQRIAELIACETGKPLAMVLADIERDHWLSAEEAKASITLSGNLLKVVDSLAGAAQPSAWIERAVQSYAARQLRERRRERELVLLNRHADALVLRSKKVALLRRSEPPGFAGLKGQSRSVRANQYVRRRPVDRSASRALVVAFAIDDDPDADILDVT